MPPGPFIGLIGPKVWSDQISHNFLGPTLTPPAKTFSAPGVGAAAAEGEAVALAPGVGVLAEHRRAT